MVKLINHWYPGITILEIVRPSRDLLRIGAESGRSYRPMLDLELCNILLKLYGFRGIKTSTTIYNSIRAITYKFSSLEHLRSIKSFRKTTLQPGLTILNLRDLYKPVIKSAIKAKIDRLKTLQI
ncbi:unnamed protein product [Fusarium fujikuroi]|uniref:Uncharacterized protein n=1 Tax=Fusarium fujikuroi TaxID=5127 RepID=A0A9Q9RS07_FUSFU|nr:unnamed protein product [Fusarium fujikuroi]